MQQLPGIIGKLPPDRQVKAELVAEIGQPLRRDAMLADPHLNRITRNKPDRHESREHQRDEGGDGQGNAAQNVEKHGGGVPPLPQSGRGPG